MSEPFIGEIRLFAGNFEPRGWRFCHGQLLPIAQNQALFAILGTTYGGNGTTYFALPDLRGRTPIAAGPGPGLTARSLGESGGLENVTLSQGHIPVHSHALVASSSAPDTASPSGAYLPTGSSRIYASGPAGPALAAGSVGPAGGGQPHPNMQPYLVLNYIIAVEGIFPSRWD